MPQVQYRDPTLLQILSLYLLLLAFFVLLFNLSRTEELKSNSVARSLNTSFSRKGVPEKEPEIFVSAEGDVIGASKEIVRKFGLLIKTAIPIAEIKVVEVGRIFQARFPVNEIFDPGRATPRPERARRIRRIADEMANPPRGIHYEVEVMFTGSRDRDEQSAKSHALSVSRAGYFARMAIAMGIPSGMIATGVAVGQPDWVEMMFHLRSRKEAPLSLDPAVHSATDSAVGTNPR
jgi:flagellar motor protein MotB